MEEAYMFRAEDLFDGKNLQSVALNVLHLKQIKNKRTRRHWHTSRPPAPVKNNVTSCASVSSSTSSLTSLESIGYQHLDLEADRILEALAGIHQSSSNVCFDNAVNIDSDDEWVQLDDWSHAQLEHEKLWELVLEDPRHISHVLEYPSHDLWQFIIRDRQQELMATPWKATILRKQNVVHENHNVLIRTLLMRGDVEKETRADIWLLMSGSINRMLRRPGYYKSLVCVSVEAALQLRYKGITSLDQVESMVSYFYTVVPHDESVFWMVVQFIDYVLPWDCLGFNKVVDRQVFLRYLQELLPSIYQHLQGLYVAELKSDSMVGIHFPMFSWLLGANKDSTDRIWDLLWYDGAIVLFRVAMTLTSILAKKIVACESIEQVNSLFQNEDVPVIHFFQEYERWSVITPSSLRQHRSTTKMDSYSVVSSSRMNTIIGRELEKPSTDSLEGFILRHKGQRIMLRECKPGAAAELCQIVRAIFYL